VRDRLWAIGDGHVGEYEGDVVAANIAGETRVANYEAVPRVTYTDPQAAAVGERDGDQSAARPDRGYRDRRLGDRLAQRQRRSTGLV